MAYAYSHADWDGLHDQLRDVPWEDIFKLSASAAASVWVQVGIDVYISLNVSIRSNLTHLHGFQQLQFSALFHCTGYDYACADWSSLCDDLRDFSWEDNFRPSVS